MIILPAPCPLSCSFQKTKNFFSLFVDANSLIYRIWSIRFNHFHDQLVLSSSSDSRVILTNTTSISSEPFGHLAEEDEPAEGEGLEYTDEDSREKYGGFFIIVQIKIEQENILVGCVTPVWVGLGGGSPSRGVVTVWGILSLWGCTLPPALPEGTWDHRYPTPLPP